MNKQIFARQRFLFFAKHIMVVFVIMQLCLVVVNLITPTYYLRLSNYSIFGLTTRIAALIAYAWVFSLISPRMKLRQRSWWLLTYLGPFIILMALATWLYLQGSAVILGKVFLWGTGLSFIYMLAMFFVYRWLNRRMPSEEEDLINSIDTNA